MPAAKVAFEEVRGLIMGELRKKYIEEQREAALTSVRDDPSTQVHHELVESLYVRPPSAEVASTWIELTLTGWVR